MDWAIIHTQSWVQVTPASGTLAASHSAGVTVALTAAADSLPAGIFTDTLMISNTTSGAVQRRPVTLQVLTPSLSIADASVMEGDSGRTSIEFLVHLNPVSRQTISVAFATSNETAQAGADFVATNGMLVFAPGQMQTSIVVQVLGDIDTELNESFSVVLSDPVNAALGAAVGTGTIISDDLPPDVYLRSITRAPWESTANETDMDRVFGTNNWQDLRFETAIPAGLFSPATRFIFMEGSDTGALELETFLTANMAALQNWVAAGGRLFLNAAPNEGTGMSFGFGVTLVYEDSTSTGKAAAPLHPIFLGPFNPAGLTWTGGAFGHATVSGPNLTALITNSVHGRTVLGEQQHGAGLVLFGGMTTDDHHSPQPEAANLRANMLDYTARFTLCSNCPPTISIQPADLTVRPGTNVTFCVTANGTTPLRYQWSRDGTNLVDGGRISGATNRCLTMTSMAEADSGNYAVFVTNVFGSVLSSNATLLVSPLDHFAWSSIPSPKLAGAPFPVTITARDEFSAVVSNFTGSVSLAGFSDGGHTTNRMLDGVAHDNSAVGTGTWGYSFTPTNNLVVTHVRHYFGTKVSLWTGTGALLASRDVVGNAGAWTETDLTTPVMLSAGSNYLVAAYVPNTNYYWIAYSAIGFANGTIAQSLYSSLDTFPTNITTSGWPMVGLRYTVGSTLPVAITPASSGNFTNGLWTGYLAALQPATNLLLVATSGGGPHGTSNPFDVMPSAPVILPLVPGSGLVGFRYATRAGWSYTVEFTIELESDSSETAWTPLQTTPGDGTVKTFTGSPVPAIPQRFYRLRIHE